MTVGLGSMRVLQRDKSGCNDPLFIYCEEGNWTAYKSNAQLYTSQLLVSLSRIQSKGFGRSGIDLALKKRNEWRICGPGPGLRMKIEENNREIHPNFLIMPCDNLISEIWLLQGHCKPWLLTSFRRNPEWTLLFLWLHRQQLSGKGMIWGTKWPQNTQVFTLQMHLKTWLRCQEADMRVWG